MKNQSARLVCGYLYANAGEGESTTDMVFSGHGLIAEDGALLAEKPPFTGGFAVTDLDIGRITAERRRLTTFPAAAREGYLSSTFSLSPRETPLTRTVPRHPFLPSLGERDGCCEQVLQIQSRGLAGGSPTQARRPPSWASRAGSIRRSPCSRRCVRPTCSAVRAPACRR